MRISVDFIFLKGGKKMPSGHQGKYIKGRFVRWLIENNILTPSDFINFKEDGYSFDGTNFNWIPSFEQAGTFNVEFTLGSI